ncbi:S1C family serine protease [Bacillus horti]|uniref:S1-C subfamily serine protease n=1 Tax=Caldalkalibacillus horti TaxID=77523 RepID=A0ABT9W3N1_9BACI|nr:trypsin-like peptidase domain-containing protein [Bacillus horti]MDQ0167860.1 S1-C subfamily serine protease [Bacillus horti]
MSAKLSKLFQDLKQSIVSIEGVKEKRMLGRRGLSPFSPPQVVDEKKISYGSGVIIHPKGHILTCHHVVDGMNMIRIKLGSEQQLYQGKVVLEYPEKDIAIVEIQAKERFKEVKFGSSKKATVGENVFAIGNPFGFDYTLTTGIISGKNRQISTEEHEYNFVLQTNTALNPGNSGGPLFNSKGRVIGINAVIIPNFQNMGFAIPTEEILPHIKKYTLSPPKKKSTKTGT